MRLRQLLVATAAILALPTAAAAQHNSLDVKLGSCAAKLVTTSPWTAHDDGTYSNPQRQAVLVPNGTSLELPILTTRPLRVSPTHLSFPLDARLLPLPSGGIFGELLAGADLPGPVSAGIDTGAAIRRLAPSLLLDPGTSYLYFSATHPFAINLDKNNKNKPQRTTNASSNKPRSGRKPKIVTTAFALDPCDPAVFFGGVVVTIQGVTVSLDGIGFSLAGKVDHKSSMPVWTGATRRNGQPDLRPFAVRGHVYAKGSIGVGLGGFLSAAGQATVSANLDPRRNGVWGLAEVVGLLNGRPPSTLPDFQLLIEGSPLIKLPGMAIPSSKLALGIDAADPRKVRLQLAGERGPSASLAQLFPGAPPPGTDLIRATGKIQLFANASFDATARRPNGTYQIKVRGVLELGPIELAGDVDITYSAGGRISVCATVPGVGRLCDAALGNAVETAGKAAVASALDGARFFQSVPGALDASFSEGLAAIGKAIKDAEHNLHGAARCNGEARNLGTKTGQRLRARMIAKAEAFFDTVRPRLQGLTPAQRASVVDASYRKFLSSVNDRRAKVNARGRDKADNWSVNPTYQRQYANSFTAAFNAAVGDDKANLDSVYRRRENVGQPWH